nr:hypothetical protein CFP56_28265 [Quercus suber]
MENTGGFVAASKGYRVFHGRAKHIPIEEPNVEVQTKGQVVVESVDSSLEGIEAKDPEADMVVRRTMTTNRFLPSEWPTTQHRQLGLKSLVEEAEKERALKEVPKTTMYGFSEGWMAVVTALGVPEDSPFRDPKQVPYPKPSPPLVQDLTHVEEESQSMRALVKEIKSHVEVIELDISSNPNTRQDQVLQPTLPSHDLQTAKDAPIHPFKQLHDPTT